MKVQKHLRDDLKVEAGRMRRNQTAKHTARGSDLDIGRRSLATLNFEKLRNVVNSNGG